MTIRADEQLRNGPTLPELLSTAAAARGHQAYATFAGETLTFEGLAAAVAQAQRGLTALGIKPGDRVAVMLPNHLVHVLLIHALIGMRAVWVPVNTRLRGDPLLHVLTDCDPSKVIVDGSYVDVLPTLPASVQVMEHDTGQPAPWEGRDAFPAASKPDGDDVVGIIYTSGTTGPAKGVQVTDLMMRAAALGVAHVSEPRDGDTYFVWEPLCHVGGAQVVFLPLIANVRLALVERFSVSNFWSQVTAAGATHIHHLGGIISLLLSAEPSDAERHNPARVSWGGGMTHEAWRQAEKRFGLEIRECYGMTEAASICTSNAAGPENGIGYPVPWFDVEVQDGEGRRVPEDSTGEIVVRPRISGLVTPGYFRNDAATADARRGDWWRTGDSGRFANGALNFVGRMSDSIRHRGENVSAWEVESVVNAYPQVTESAVIGVPGATGEEDIKVFVAVTDEAAFSPDDLADWCRDRLASFQVPRYIAMVQEFTKTPSLRIQKATLPRTPEGHDMSDR